MIEMFSFYVLGIGTYLVPLIVLPATLVSPLSMPRSLLLEFIISILN